MGPTKEDVLRLLDEYGRAPKLTGPVTLRPAYFAAVERWEALPGNQPGVDKSWVGRCQRAFEAHFARVRPSA